MFFNESKVRKIVNDVLDQRFGPSSSPFKDNELKKDSDDSKKIIKTNNLSAIKHYKVSVQNSEVTFTVFFYENTSRSFEIQGSISIIQIQHLAFYNTEILAWVARAIELYDIPNIKFCNQYNLMIKNLMDKLNIDEIDDIRKTLEKYHKFYVDYNHIINHMKENDKSYLNNLEVLLKLKETK